MLGIAAAANGPTREVVVKPVDQTNEKFVRYKQWVEGRRAYVAKASGGRLGYVHMIDMSQDSLNQLYLDLDAENRSRDGVVIDMRNNTGGFVNVYAIDVLARRGYMQMLQRGFESDVVADLPWATVARTSDHPRHQSAFAVRRRGFHRRVSGAEARESGG